LTEFPKIVPIDDTEQARANAIEQVRNSEEFLVLTKDKAGEAWGIYGAWVDFTNAVGAAQRYFTRLELQQMLLEAEEEK
jgi:hypothetical protein